MAQFKNALVSVSDKTGLIEFIKPLAQKGMRVVSTGGTAKFLEENGIKVVQISEQTGFPEVMDGRVKTLHPNVHMALLARKDEADDLAILKKHNLEPFDLVVGNLYPFESKPDIENIDIGGPSFLRSASKSFDRIAVVVDPQDYAKIAASAELTLDDRKLLAAKVFAHTSAYDSMITAWLEPDFAKKRDQSVGGKFQSELRYGENPQQKAVWYRQAGVTQGLHQAKILQGKELSYNNLLDLTAAVQTLRRITTAASSLAANSQSGNQSSAAACVAVKHNNPCGIAVASSIAEATKLAIEADPVSVFGGILALSQPVDDKSAEILSALFLECVVAPSFTPAAQSIFAKKKNLRLLEWSEMLKPSEQALYRQIDGGFLMQTPDDVASKLDSAWTVVGEKPSPEIEKDLIFAWNTVAHLKSNAIAITLNQQTLGLGMGQVNRVDAVQHALDRMTQAHGERIKSH
ncbi:MAG: bifunctional phosphoribosylaminoimidazolecarboxamide formyltransferase/IMP cyclohydrolase, partial [Bdellovibrionota bacterium]